LKQVRFVAGARRDLLDGVAFYDKSRAGQGARFTHAVEQAAARALAFPRSGSPAAANTRRIIVTAFAFSLFYREDGAEIVIFAVAHHTRDPEYWARREAGESR